MITWALRLAGTAALLLALLGWAGPGMADPPQDGRSRVVAALENVMALERPGQVGLAAVWDGDKYVQCRRVGERVLHCEAAGALMQPSLGHVLVPERVKRLAELGWRLDASFGNYAQTFPANTRASQIADRILQTLSEGYDVDLATLDVETDWIDSEPCPPRNGPGQNLAGLINDAPAMAATAVHACALAQPPGSTPPPSPLSADALVGLYGPRVTGDVQRLRVNIEREVFFVLQTDTGYIQCQPETATRSIYCEAESADSWPVLANVLTPERLARLHAAGFADPGRAPNYWKAYPIGAGDDAAIARELLTILHDVYGYTGSPKLEFASEKGSD